MSNFSCLGRLKLLNYTFPGGRPAKPEINANLSPAWLAGAWAELGKSMEKKFGQLYISNTLNIHHQTVWIQWLSRPKLIETGIFYSCQNTDSSRLENLEVVETETH